jgi:hypothetical protein
MYRRSKAYVSGQLGLICEPLRIEDFCCELVSDDWANAWMSGENFDSGTDCFFTECLFDFLFGGFEMFCDEAKLFDEHIEAVTKMFRQADTFEFFNSRDGPVRKSVRLVDTVLQEKAFNLEFDACLFCDKLFSQTSELTLSLLMFGGYCNVFEKTFGCVFGELASNRVSRFWNLVRLVEVSSKGQLR